ncbi:MAG TPA: hypothetical protein VLA99_17940 [Nitrospiraceae bacterium]|nr:hypothetical protein [Nitrospiraceae bacterium]
MIHIRLGMLIVVLLFCGSVQGCVEPDRYMTDEEQAKQAEDKDSSREAQPGRSQRPSRSTSSPGTTGSY